MIIKPNELSSISAFFDCLTNLHLTVSESSCELATRKRRFCLLLMYTICFFNIIKDSILRKNNEKLSIIHRLWQGVFDKEGRFFTSTFWEFVEKDEIGMMEYIGEKPSGIDKFDKLKWSCLHTVAYCIHPKLISMRYTTDNYNVQQKHLNTLKTLFLQHFTDLMNFSNGGNLPIHLACQMNNVLILKIIIDVANEKLSQKQFKEMLNQVKKDKYWNYTPLMVAIKNNSIGCIKLLCQHDCVVNGIFKYKSRYPNYDSFEFACYYNNVESLKILLYVCDVSELTIKLLSKEYISYLKRLANYGLSKGYILKSKCVEFVDDLFCNPMAAVKLKESKLSSNATNTASNNKENKMKYVCCRNHLLPPRSSFTQEKCDICDKNNTRCRECKKCASQRDSNLFPSIICEKCVIATSMWSTIVHTTEHARINGNLEQMISNLINADTVNRVEFE